MASLLFDSVTVGVFPLPDTALRFVDPKSLVNKIPAGFFELKPVIPPLNSAIQNLLDKIGVKPEKPPVYISPYDNFTLPVTASANIPNEFITNMSITGPIACMLEDPLPSLKFPDALRSLEQAIRIGISPWWAPGLFFEPFVRINPVTAPVVPSPVTVIPSGAGPGYPTFTSNISGYYTERNWTDREWILKESDVIAKYNINGRFVKPWKPNNQEYPIDTMSINRYRPSLITPLTYYATNILTGSTIEEVMIPYIRCAEHVMSYKASEIRSMRFYFLITIDSVIYPPYTPILQPPPPSIILKTPFIAHMSVDTNNDWMSMLKILVANQVANGPCDGTERIYDDLDDVPPKEGTEDLESQCFAIEKETDEYIKLLEDDFAKFIEDNTSEEESET